MAKIETVRVRQYGCVFLYAVRTRDSSPIGDFSTSCAAANGFEILELFCIFWKNTRADASASDWLKETACH